MGPAVARGIGSRNTVPRYIVRIGAKAASFSLEASKDFWCEFLFGSHVNPQLSARATPPLAVSAFVEKNEVNRGLTARKTLRRLSLACNQSSTAAPADGQTG